MIITYAIIKWIDSQIQTQKNKLTLLESKLWCFTELAINLCLCRYKWSYLCIFFSQQFTIWLLFRGISSYMQWFAGIYSYMQWFAEISWCKYIFQPSLNFFLHYRVDLYIKTGACQDTTYYLPFSPPLPHIQPTAYRFQSICIAVICVFWEINIERLF